MTRRSTASGASRSTRRTFLKNITAAGLVGSFVAPSIVRASANEKINLAHVGVGGKGKTDMMLTSQGHNVVALCDIDRKYLAEAGKLFPQAKIYTDWRELLQQKILLLIYPSQILLFITLIIFY